MTAYVTIPIGEVKDVNKIDSSSEKRKLIF